MRLSSARDRIELATQYRPAGQVGDPLRHRTSHHSPNLKLACPARMSDLRTPRTDVAGRVGFGGGRVSEATGKAYLPPPAAASRGSAVVAVSRHTSTTQYGPGSGLVIEKLRTRAIAARSSATRQ